jgi:hypothetical protein
MLKSQRPGTKIKKVMEFEDLKRLVTSYREKSLAYLQAVQNRSSFYVSPVELKGKEV